MAGKRTIAGLISVTAAASAALFRLGQVVEARELVKFDHRVRASLLGVRTRALDALSAVITALNAPAFLVPATLAVAFAQRKRGIASWLPMALSPLAAMTAGQLMTTWGPHQFPPDSSDDTDRPSFPSSHTTGLTAETLTVVWVLRHERRLSEGASSLLMLVPQAAGLNRLYRDRHWATDIAGGLAAGTAVGAICAISCELLQPIDRERTLPSGLT